MTRSPRVGATMVGVQAHPELPAEPAPGFLEEVA
jgi:hypothetical protein